MILETTVGIVAVVARWVVHHHHHAAAAASVVLVLVLVLVLVAPMVSVCL